MLLEDFLIPIDCLLDDEMPEGCVCHSDPASRLSDSEVLCIKVAGLLLGDAQDKDNFAYFRARITPSSFLIQAHSSR